VDVNTPLLRELQMLMSRNGQSPYVFSNPETGKPYLDTKKGFKAACRRAGIEGLRFHDLRHTFASRLVERGVDLITVKDLLGHSTVKMTERYTYSSRQSKKNAVELLARRNPEREAFQETPVTYTSREKSKKLVPLAVRS
jgi:integrase